MSVTAVSICINIIQVLIITMLIFIIVFILRKKRREKIINYNQRMIDREKFTKELNKDKGLNDDKIKNAENVGDITRIYNDIMFDDADHNR